MRRSLWVFLLLAGVAAMSPAQLTTERAGTSQLLIAAAGAVTGANGTFFRSDITLVNYRDTDQRVRLDWLPQGVSGVGAAPVDMVIPKGTGITSEDFVTEIVKQSGLGSILVTALTADGQFDPQGKLHATARIWSNQPGLSSGTVSQTFPIISLNDINSPNPLRILGQRRDDRYRTNLGIINMSPAEQTFRVTVLADTRTELSNVTVPGLSMQQVPLTGPAAANLQIAVASLSGSSNWIAYGSSVDNATGDSWSSLAFYVP